MPINPSKSFKYDYIQYIWLQLKGFLKIILLKITTLRKRGKKMGIYTQLHLCFAKIMMSGGPRRGAVMMVHKTGS